MIKQPRSWRDLSPAIAAGFLNLPVGTQLGDINNPNTFLPAVANRIADILVVIAYPLAFVGVLYCVYLLLAQSGTPDAFKTTKKNIGYIATGIFLLIFTIIILNFVSRFFTV